MCLSPSKETIRKETLLTEREAVLKTLGFFIKIIKAIFHIHCHQPELAVGSQRDETSEAAQTEDTTLTELS